MNNTASGKFLVLAFGTIIYAIILFLIMMTLPLAAQTNETGPGAAGNAIIAPVESPAATNAVPASNAVAAVRGSSDKSAGSSTPVRVDRTGIHVGGPQPVDVNWGHDFGGPGFGNTLVAVLTAFVLPVTIVVVLPLTIVAIAFYAIHRRNKLLHENLRIMIDKGMPITPELVETLKGKYSGVSPTGGQSPAGAYHRSRRLLPGLILIGAGAALMINEHHFSGGGLIVLFVGVAFLIVWLVERVDRNSSQPPKA